MLTQTLVHVLSPNTFAGAGRRLEDGALARQIGMALLKKDSSARRAPRVPVDLRGSVSHRGSWDVSVLDLSVGGCLLQSPGALDSGTIVDLGVEVGARRLTAKARVIDV